MNNYIKEKVKSLEESIISSRRDFHKHPETGWTEFRTAAIAIKRMKELGYTITMGKDAIKVDEMMGVPSPQELQEHQQRAIAQGADKDIVEAMTGGLTGFWADMKFTDDKPLLALRFDMDANDVNESQDSEHRPTKEGFASLNSGVMHACGHDGHVAIGLAVAEIIAEMKDRLKGSIRFIFEPGEEGSRGAGPMVSSGAVKDVDAILGMHIGFQAVTEDELICGAKGFLATTKWDVQFHGLSAHAGAAPQEGKNALLAACVAALNLHAISRHGDGTTRINVGKLIAGEGRNVIPPNARIVMETRGATSELDEFLITEAGRIIKAAAEMYDCTYDITVMGSTKSGESDIKTIDMIEEIGKEMPCFKKITRIKDFGACEDFSQMMSVVQANGGFGAYTQVGANRRAGHHNNKFDFDETALFNAVELSVRSAVKILAK